MQIELETLPNCITAMRIELPPERVAQERQSILRDFQGSARLPGYRPGKAPRNLVEAKYKKEIIEELERKLVAAGTREAIAEKKLRVLAVADVEKVELNQDNIMRFTAKLVTAPEFDLPPYQSLPVKIPPAEVTDAEMDATLERLRSRMADFNNIEGRGIEMEDFAVIDFAGRIEDKPVSEAFPNAPKELGGQENFWIKLGPKTLLPGFSEALLGANAGDTREFSLEVPADFPIAELVGKRVDYTVKVRELKMQVLPEINDDFAAKLLPGKTLEELRAQMRSDMNAERARIIDETKRQQIIDHLLGGVDFELPTDYVKQESRRIMNSIVRQNQERGVSEEEIRNNQKEIVVNAAQAARERIKSAFILTRIAEKENIRVTREEFNERLDSMAARSNMSRDKLVKTLQEREALGQLEEELLVGKTLAFLSSNASVEVVSPTPSESAETE
jgi:trigger factor